MTQFFQLQTSMTQFFQLQTSSRIFLMLASLDQWFSTKKKDKDVFTQVNIVLILQICNNGGQMTVRASIKESEMQIKKGETNKHEAVMELSSEKQPAELNFHFGEIMR